jgi:hypothetical protein
MQLSDFNRSTLDFKADAALEAARQLPHGPERTQALKTAGMLRNAADQYGIIFAPKGRPRK